MKFSRSDATVTAVVMILSAFLFFLFWKDLNAVTARNSETSLGNIEFRRGSATRRAPAGMNWERLRSQSPVYGGDTIRTADFSEAAVYFDDGADLDLFENSMIKLNFTETNQIMEFVGGRMSLSGGDGRTIVAGSRTVTFSEDSQVSFSRTDDEIAIGVNNGTATVKGTDGRVDVLRISQELRMDANSGEYQVIDHPAVLLGPEQDSRLLSPEGREDGITFSWRIDSPEVLSGALVLELSRNSEFDLVQTVPVVGQAESLETKLEAGIWYWRLRDENGPVSPNSRFSLTETSLTEPILPDDGATYRYRKIPPPVLFSWTEMTEASAYVFEVAAEPGFQTPIIRSRTTLTSLTVNALDEGTWYWRVAPLPVGEILSGGEEPVVRRIEIVKRSEMEPPKLLYGLDGELFQLQAMEGQGIPFSWEPEREALEYQLAVADSPEMETPRVSISTGDPFAYLVSENAEALQGEGTYYWSVRWKDNEGNLSPWSTARQLKGVDGDMAVRLSYPPEGYTVADSLMSNTRFAWKSNVPGRTVFQVSGNPEFSELAYEEEVDAETLLGKEWGAGQWYWRVRTFNVDGTVFLETPSREFEVVEPFEGPLLTQPEPGRLYTFREGDEQKIAWEDVPEADHYSLKIIPAAGGAPVYEQSLIPSEEISLSFDNFPDGSYRALIQGFTLESPLSTRRIGLIRESAFALRKLTPIELKTPVDGEDFEGLVALRQGIPLVWDVKSPPDNSVLRVYSDSAMNQSVYTGENGPRRVIVRPLPAGNYYWTVSGDFEEFDISARTVGRFTVNPIPPLPGPLLTAPAPRTVIGPERLRTNRQILFTWEPVDGATDYHLKVFADGNLNEPVLSAGPLKDTAYLLEDLSVLDKGDFIWMVFAESRNEEGLVEQPGEEAESDFTINLPNLGSPNMKSGETFYGR